MKKYSIILLLLFVSIVCDAQSDLSFHLNKYDRKENTYDDITPQIFDIENAPIYTLKRNPSFVHLYYNKADSALKDYSMKRMDTKNILKALLLYNKTDGDYNFNDGNKSLKGELLASGEIVFQGYGTLYGSASYSSERKENIQLNYATNMMDYYPYIVSDTIGCGKVTFERYEIDGGFGFQHKGFYYGIGGSYKGVSSYKLTDPRLSVYTYWFRFDIGVTKIVKNNLFSLKVYPEFNKQNISVSNYKQQTAKFFQFYGFGAWNKNESKGGYNYGRMMSITGYGIDFAYKKLTANKNSLGYSVNIVYNYRKMDTEEDSFKKLFSSYTHHFKPEITLSKKYNNFHFHLLITGDNNMRDGSEHVYENKKISEEQNLYKPVKVASNDMYNMNSFSNSLLFKTIYNHSLKQSYHLLGGINYSHYEEKYVMPVKRITNQSITPIIGIGYNRVNDKSSIETNLRFSTKIATDNVFNLPQLEEKTSILQAYIPYLIRGEESYTLLAEFAYSYAINHKSSIGGCLSIDYKKRTNAPYINHLFAFKEPNREVSAFKASLFYIF